MLFLSEKAAKDQGLKLEEVCLDWFISELLKVEVNADMVSRYRRWFRFYANFLSHAKAASELANFISGAPVGNQARPNEISSDTFG